MMRKFLLIYILLCFISVSAIAEGETSVKLDVSDIEAQERLQIISELTFRLDTRQTCAQSLNWDDSGSGADLDGYFFIPRTGQTDYMIGGYAAQKRSSKFHCVLIVSEPTTNPKGTPPLLVAPVDWKLIWKDKGSGANKDGSLWQAIPPDSNYRCIGSVSQIGYNKPKLPNFRCVHSSLTEKVVTKNILWSDKGSGADKQVTVLRLPVTGSYTAVSARVNQIEAIDLKENAISEPDPKTVDEILAKRMEHLKAEIEAQTKAKLEEKQKEAEQKLAEEAEQKKIAEEVEKKRLAEKAKKAEQKRSEVEKQQLLAEEAKEAEQARLAEVEEQKPSAVIAEQKKSTEEQQQKEVEVTEQQKVVEEQEPKSLAEEKPEKIEKPIAAIDTASTGEDKKGSKGLTDLIMDIVKVFLLLVGGIIFMVVVFKFVLGSKKAPTEK